MPDTDRRDSEALIDVLSQGVRPVRRVAPAGLRALGWVPAALALGYLSTRMLHRFPTDWSARHAVISLANVALCLMIGIAAFAGSLSLSVAGGQVRAKAWLAAGALAWVLLAMTSIGLAARPLGFVVGVGSYCFTFVLTAGLPMVAIAVAALRRTRSLTPKLSLAAAGLGIAFLSFALLAFCHPAEMSFADFLMHLLAALVLAGITVLIGRPLIRA